MALEPITRAEQIMSGESLEPITREEMFLAKAAGMDVDTPEPITRREMFLSMIQPGGGSGLPSGSSPNQYLVTDGDGNAKWEDKLCWSETAEEVILPVCQPEYSEEMDGMSIFTEEREIGFTVGTEYIVNWNGTEYVCVAKETANGDVYLGNGVAFTGDDSGEPFMVAVAPSIGLQFIDFNGSTTLTISIHRVTETIHKLSGKYVEGMGWSEIEYALPECQPEMQSASGESAFVFTETVKPFVVGDTYIVRWNGADYTCIAQDASHISEGMVVIGDGSRFDLSGNGEPFMIGQNDSMCAAYAFDGSENVTISIRQEAIHPIDKKYLMGSNLRVFITVDENDNLTASHTYEEIKNHVLSGGTCDCVYGIYILRLSKAEFMADVVTTYGAPFGIEFIVLKPGTICIVNITEDDVVTFSEGSFSFEVN